MTKPSGVPTPTADRIKADRLRKLRDDINGLGKRTLLGMFEAGEALDEAAGLLRGSYSAWVLAECRIEPRTALGYRKTFRILGEHREWLAKVGVAPSVALAIASATPEGRGRALAALESGRTLTVAQTKALVRENRPGEPPKRRLWSLDRMLRAFSVTFLDEVERIVSLASVDHTDENGPMELAVRARVLSPILMALSARPAGGGDPLTSPMVDALTDLANAPTIPDIVAAAARLARIASEEGGEVDGIRADTDPASAVARSASTVPAVLGLPLHGILSTTSVLSHGLTAIEICAGAGGQAAGLSKAGFRHLRLVERNVSACETLRAAFGSEPVVEADLVGYEPGEIGPVDLLAGGVPCQPYSQAGMRKGADDGRDLFPEALRLVARIRPRAVMLENVMGILEPDNDLHRFRILGYLRRMGYHAEWRAVDASHFGVPQKRRRTILIAFRETEAMARFRWPQAIHHHVDEPHPAIAALDGHLRSRGWTPTPELQDRMDRAAPTVMGGSDRKQGIDFGQRKSAAVWGEMGFVQTRIGKQAPGPDHEGDVEATNPMLATLQGFPSDWPFRGSRKEIFRQIANALPPPVAFRLGCAIASALSGKHVDPDQQLAYEGMRWIHVPRGTGDADNAAKPGLTDRRAAHAGVRLPLDRLGNSMPTWVAETPPVLDWDDESEAPQDPDELTAALEVPAA